MSTQNLCLEQKYENIKFFFYLQNFHFGGKIFCIFEQARFRNVPVDVSEILLYVWQTV